MPKRRANGEGNIRKRKDGRWEGRYTAGYDPDAFRRTHDKILKAIGAEHIRFHDLRHTFATLSLKSGVDVKTLSGALGHYSAGFTLNTYTHATAQMKQDAANTIGGVISQQMR